MVVEVVVVVVVGRVVFRLRRVLRLRLGGRGMEQEKED